MAGQPFVEIEPIRDYDATFVRRPSDALDGKLRVLTINDEMPPPRIELRRVNGSLTPVLLGFPGQVCFVSHTRDLTNWTPDQEFTLKTESTTLVPKSGAGDGLFFYRALRKPATTELPTSSVAAPH